MSDISIGLSGLLAAQTALDVTGQNITNSSTPGYARRQVQLSETPSLSSTGVLSGGAGVTADTIVRDRDMFLYGQVQSSNADLSAATAQSQYLNQIQSLLQEPSGGGISTQLEAFFNAWQALAADPNDPTVRNTLLGTAQQLTQSIQSLRSGLLGVQNSISQEIGGDVSQANKLTSELAQNNRAHDERHRGQRRAALRWRTSATRWWRSWLHSPAPSIPRPSRPPPRCRRAAPRSSWAPPASR